MRNSDRISRVKFAAMFFRCNKWDATKLCHVNIGIGYILQISQGRVLTPLKAVQCWTYFRLNDSIIFVWELFNLSLLAISGSNRFMIIRLTDQIYISFRGPSGRFFHRDRIRLTVSRIKFNHTRTLFCHSVICKTGMWMWENYYTFASFWSLNNIWEFSTYLK